MSLVSINYETHCCAIPDTRAERVCYCCHNHLMTDSCGSESSFIITYLIRCSIMFNAIMDIQARKRPARLGRFTYESFL